MGVPHPRTSDLSSGVRSPRVSWDEQTFRAMYAAEVDGETVTYGPAFWAQPSVDHTFNWRAVGCLELGVPPGSRVLVVGAAWGHLCAALGLLGIEATGCDSSPFVAAHQDEHLATVLFADVRQLVPSDVPGLDWVITESVLESYDKAEGAEIIAACHRLAPRVAHLIYEQLSPVFRVQTMEDWALEDPGAEWAAINRWRLI